MRNIIVLSFLFSLFACNQNPIVQDKQIVTECNVTRMYDTGTEIVRDTLAMRAITSDTARVFIYTEAFNSNVVEDADTIIISGKNIKRKWAKHRGNVETIYCGEQSFLVNGEKVIVKKARCSAIALRHLSNIFYNDSIGKIMEKGVLHPSGKEVYVFYNESKDKALHQAIMTDSVFSKFELMLD